MKIIIKTKKSKVWQNNKFYVLEYHNKLFLKNQNKNMINYLMLIVHKCKVKLKEKNIKHNFFPKINININKLVKEIKKNIIIVMMIKILKLYLRTKKINS